MGIGMGAVERAVERSESRGTGDGSYLPSIFWEDDKKGKGEQYQKVIRFISDEPVTALFYEFVRGGPVREDGTKAPRDFIVPSSLVDDDDMPLYEEVADERDFFKANSIQLPNFKQVMKPAKAQERTVGIAVLREEYKADGKTKVRDKIVKREWKDEDGKDQESEGLSFGTIKQSHKMFWSTLVGYYQRFGTICDRDYLITRQGKGLDTTYIIIPLPEDPELDSIDKVIAKYWETEEIDDPKNKGQKKTVLAAGDISKGKCPMTMKEWCIPKAKYDNAKEWYYGDGESKSSKNDDSEKSDSSSKATPEDDEKAEREQEVRTPKESTTKSLREELESYAQG